MRAGVVATGHRPRARQRAVQVERGLEIERLQSSFVGGAEALQRVDQRIARGVPEPAVARCLQQAGSADGCGPGRAASPCWPCILSITLRSSVVPTRHGVQKPQLSCAKKCAKLRATSNMSRVSSNTMNAPAVGRSSKPMRRSNSVGPDADPRRSADLHRLRPRRAAVVKHLSHGDAERVLVDAGPCAVTGDRQQLRPRGAWRTDASVPVTACEARSSAAAQNVSTLLTTVGCCR